jgi:hypothetical protein
MSNFFIPKKGKLNLLQARSLTRPALLSEPHCAVLASCTIPNVAVRSFYLLSTDAFVGEDVMPRRVHVSDVNRTVNLAVSYDLKSELRTYTCAQLFGMAIYRLWAVGELSNQTLIRVKFQEQNRGASSIHYACLIRILTGYQVHVAFPTLEADKRRPIFRGNRARAMSLSCSVQHTPCARVAQLEL